MVLQPSMTSVGTALRYWSIKQMEYIIPEICIPSLCMLAIIVPLVIAIAIKRGYIKVVSNDD